MKKWPSLDGSESNSILISTTEDGYNSGRKYYLKLETNQSCADLFKALQRFSADAIKRAKGKAVFQRSQTMLKRALNSSPIQGLAAFLVIAVSLLSPLSRKSESRSYVPSLFLEHDAARPGACPNRGVLRPIHIHDTL